MKFSVLMTVYVNDNPIYLYKALLSIIKQSLVPTEIVIVKDGIVTDDILKVLEKAKTKHNNIKIVSLEENKGQSEALNQGLLNCSYDLVARMDSDDISTKKRFELQINVFNEDSSIDAVSGTTEDFSSDGKKYGKRVLPQGGEELYQFSKKRSPLNHGAVMYKKEKVLAVGGYKKFIQVQDYILWADMLSNNCKFYNLKEVLLKVRVDDKYSRKGTKNYVKEEILLQKYLYKEGLISKFVMYMNMLTKIGVRIFPKKILFFIYKKLLRS
jgi:glycosyltransferase